MTLPTYPVGFPGLAFPVKWTPQFFNAPTAIAATGAAIDIGLAATPLHNFELTYAAVRDTTAAPSEFQQLMGFFLKIGGRIGRFGFHNPDDYLATAQVLATADGTTTVYGPLQRQFGVVGASEPIGILDLTVYSTFPTLFAAVYLNGVLQAPSTYDWITTTPCNQQVSFHSAPGAGVVITVDLAYLYYCRFAEDIQTFEKFVDKWWMVSQVKLQSCRAGA